MGTVMGRSTGTRSRKREVTIAFKVCLLLLLVRGMVACNSNPGPPAASSVEKAIDLGTIPTNPDILGRDGGYSAVFQGYSVWLYGDTFLANPNADDRGLISDSWSFTTDLNAQDGITGFQERLDSAGAPSMILVETPAEFAFNQAHNGNPCQVQPCGARWALWPSSIVTDPTSKQAFVFYMVVSAMPGNFNFQGIGNSVAVWRDFSQSPQRPTFNPPIVADHPDLMFNQNEPNFGSAAFIADGTLYAYGCDYSNGCKLGKVDPSSVQDRSVWSFYAGNGSWSSEIGDAISVFGDANILSVSWNGFLQQYVAVYSPSFSQNVVMRTSPNPEGPWSPEVTVFVAMQPTSGNVYDAHAHSEYDVNGGQTIFVTYSRATGTFTSEVRLVSVTLQRP